MTTTTKEGNKTMTYTTAHTPGPWIVSGIDTFTPTIVEPRSGFAVARAETPGNINASHIRLAAPANAQLIAAAPELLAALQTAAEQMQEYSTTEIIERDVEFAAALDGAEAAIAKATGQAVQS